MQVGLALIPDFQFGVVFRDWEERRILSSTACLLENLAKLGNTRNLTVEIPANWLCFFGSMLLSSDQAGWAKDFLASGAPVFLSDNTGNISLPIPDECPTSATLTCIPEVTVGKSAETKLGKEPESSPQDGGLQLGLDLSPSLPSTGEGTRKKKSLKRPTPLVESQVRRSSRLKQISNGFKSPSCLDKKCSCCDPTPPTLSSKVIRNLGTQFCSMNEEYLQEENLSRNEGRKEPVGRKKSKNASGKDDKVGRDVKVGDSKKKKGGGKAEGGSSSRA
jgi:hypothetical protein